VGWEVGGSTMSNGRECAGVCLPDELYDEFMEQLKGVPVGKYVEGRFTGDVRKSRVWMDVSGALWCRSPRVPDKDLRCVRLSAAESDPELAVPVGEWPSQALYRRLVAGGVAEERATMLVAKLYQDEDCRTVLPDAFVERIIEQNRAFFKKD
jgi:hypothetical protein